MEVKESASDDSYTEWSTGDYVECRGTYQHPTFDQTPYDLLIVDITGDEATFTSGNVGTGLEGWDGYSYDTYLTSRSERTAKHLVPGQPTVRITAKWGYSATVPTPIREACAMQTVKWYKKFEGAGADRLASNEFGQIPLAETLDDDVKAILMLGRYVKPAVGKR